MRIPSARLVSALTPGLSFEVRTSDYQGFDAAMPYTEAVARAIRGEIEGVASQSGNIKYLRLLSAAERSQIVDITPEDRSGGGKSTVVARTNLGVYRQEIESTLMDEFGMATRIIIGHTFAFCALRSAGM